MARRSRWSKAADFPFRSFRVFRGSAHAIYSKARNEEIANYGGCRSRVIAASSSQYVSSAHHMTKCSRQRLLPVERDGQ